MSIDGWVRAFGAVVVMTVASSAAAQEPMEPAWSAHTGHAVVVEKQDGSRVSGKLVRVEEGSVEVEGENGSRTVIERAAVKALRTRLRGQQVIVTMSPEGEQVSGKLAESDERTVIVETDDGRRVTLDRASIKTVRERFPEARAAAPPPLPLPGAAPVGPPWAARGPGEEPVVDGVRVRGGLGVGSGVFIVAPSGGAYSGSIVVQPALDVSARFGLQLNHYFSLYYQNMATLVVASDGSGGLFSDYNSLLLGLTAAHHLDLAAGPSVDASTIWGAASASVVNLGMHVRLAYNLLSHGNRADEPRRSGMSIGIDVHPTFVANGTFALVGVGLGYEWY
jgi:ribosome maturation factor RimP